MGTYPDGLLHVSWLMGAMLKAATEFIEEGVVGVNNVGIQGRTPLHWAVIKELVDVVTYLVAQGANKNIVDHMGYTPIAYAQLIENQDILDALGV